jgi:DNA polymerase
MHTLWLDTETYNKRDISAGTYAYAETAEVMLIPYAVDDEPVQLIDLTMPEEYYDEHWYFDPLDYDSYYDDPNAEKQLEEFKLLAASRDCKKVAFNSMFDRTILAHELLCTFDPAEWECIMVQAMAHGLPASLDKLGEVMGLGSNLAKVKEGKKYIQRFCKPAPSNHNATRYTKYTHPEEWERFKQYAIRDVEAMREIAKRLPTWNTSPDNWADYHLDQRINDRGFEVDRELVEAGAVASEREKKRIKDRFKQLVGGVCTPTQRAKFLDHLNSTYNLGIENTQKATLEPLLNTSIPETAKELITLSLQANKTSTAKYAKLAPAISKDGRFRGGLQFCGASRTRRWAGRTFQPQNLPSRGLPKQHRINSYIDALKGGYEYFTHENLMLHGSAALRAVVKAPKGKVLLVADLANIEGRANAYLAGEQWKLDAFRAFDNGTGDDLYKITAGGILGCRPADVDSTNRNTFGKVPELALGYQGGVGGLQTFAKTYGVRMSDYWHVIASTFDSDIIEKAKYNYETWGQERAGDIDELEWIASEAVKLSWRARHPAIVSLWHACEDAARNAIEHPGLEFKAGEHLTFIYGSLHSHNWLLCRMSSGNYLTYYNPRITKDGLTCMGVDGVTKQWTVQHLYGGKFVENACQSWSRDIMAHNMRLIERGGFLIVLTVHDEVISEGDADKIDTFTELLQTVPDWAAGMPIAAEGFHCEAYRK